MSSKEIRKAYRANGIIKHLADYLCEKKEKWTRADLTEHLKKFGIVASGDEVSEMVFCAYKSSHDDDNILQAFTTNSYDCSIVEDSRLDNESEGKDLSKAFKTTERELESTGKSIKKLEKSLNQLNDRVTNHDIVSEWDDPKKDEKGRRELIQNLLNDYVSLVDAYRTAENNVRNNVADFSTLCANFMQTCREYEMRLVEIYGTKVMKECDPKKFDGWDRLFDFGGDYFLNVDKMFPHANLKDSHIFDNCQSLNYATEGLSTRNSTGGYKSVAAREKAKKLAAAEAKMQNSAVQSSKKEDVKTFVSNIKDDIGKIESDKNDRLTPYYESLCNILQNAIEFNAKRKEILTSDFPKVINKIYGGEPKDQEIKANDEDRLELLKNLKDNDDQINDHYQNIDIFQTQISEINASFSDERKRKFNEASKGPRKHLFNRTKREEEHKRWGENDKVYIDIYKSLENDLKKNEDKLQNHEDSLKKAKEERENIGADLKKLSRQLRKDLEDRQEENVNKMDAHKNNLIDLLKLGLEISKSILALNPSDQQSLGSENEQ